MNLCVVSLGLVLAIVILPLAIAEPNLLEYEFNIDKDGDLLGHKIRLGFGKPGDYVPENGSYSIVIKDDEENIVLERSYDISFFLMTNPPTALNNTLLSDSVRYSKDMHSIELRKGDTTLHEETLSFCDNDGQCADWENHMSCPSDCPLSSPDGVCTKSFDGVCDPDCLQELDKDCTCGDGVCQDYESPIACPEDCDDLEDNFCLSAEDGVCDPDCGDKDPDCVPDEAGETIKEGSPFDWTWIIIIAVVGIAVFAYLWWEEYIYF